MLISKIVSQLIEDASDLAGSQGYYAHPDILLSNYGGPTETYTFGFDLGTGDNLKVVKGKIFHARMGFDYSENYGLGRVAIDRDFDETYVSMWEPGRRSLESGVSYWLTDKGLDQFKKALKTLESKGIISGDTFVTLDRSKSMTVSNVLSASPVKTEEPSETKSGKEHTLTPTEKEELKKLKADQDKQVDNIVKKPRWYSGAGARAIPGYESHSKVQKI